MRGRVIVAVVLIMALTGAVFFLRFMPSRTGQQPQNTVAIATVQSAPVVTPLPSPVTSATATALAATSATAAATLVDTNLLTLMNGAIVRRWTVVPSAAGEALVLGNPYLVTASYAQPVVLLYQLPSAEQIDKFGAVVDSAASATVAIAAGNDPRSLSDVGTIRITPTSPPSEQTLNVTSITRYVRFMVTRPAGAQMVVERLAAYGTAGTPRAEPLAGNWLTSDSVDGLGGALFGSVKGSIPGRLPADAHGIARQTLVQGGALVAYYCDYASSLPLWRGTVANGIATGANGDRLQVAGDGELLVGKLDGVKTILMRSPATPPSCRDVSMGRGAAVLVLTRFGGRTLPEIDPAAFPGYLFHRILAPKLSPSSLRGVKFAMLDGECTATQDFSPQQQRLLLDWVAAGNKLVIRDADMCKSSDYSFLPYPLTTSATGALGAPGKVLTIADPSELGTGTQGSPHYLDTRAYLSAVQEIGDSDIMKTEDSHWCGHMMAVNAKGVYGWVHAYARYGQGLIIYNGFDHDDDMSRIPAALAISRFEYQLPVHTQLPCNARVASKLVLYPGFSRRLPAGVPQVVRAPLTMVYSGGTAANVVLHVGGDARYTATVEPANVNAPADKSIPLTASISLPKGWSGLHAFTVYADGGEGARAQSTIMIDGSVPLAQAFARQRRVRVYGIHFDVDSAAIRPESEATIAQIAQVLRANPTWRLRVEGYTDGDGGAAYNQRLSERRAQSVVSDLARRYRVERSRLVPAGYGLTHPVASNDTEGGKALNRRVELVRI